MDKITYQEYLQSDHWKRIREEALNRDNRQCQICGSKNNLHVHHLRYKYLECEYADDLVVLCAECHDRLHKTINSCKSVQYEIERRWLDEASGLLCNLAEKYRAKSAYMTAAITNTVLHGKNPANTATAIKIIRETANNLAGEGGNKLPIAPRCNKNSHTMACQIFSKIRTRARFDPWMEEAAKSVIDISEGQKKREST